jgi:hypothetical protein
MPFGHVFAVQSAGHVFAFSVGSQKWLPHVDATQSMGQLAVVSP